MRVGDKVLCKKDFTHNKDIIFREGLYYTIEKLWYIDDYETYYGSSWQIIKNKSQHIPPSDWVEIYGTPCKNYNNPIRHFSLIKVGECNYINEYFKSVGEIRKEKLKKIRRSL